MFTLSHAHEELRQAAGQSHLHGGAEQIWKTAAEIYTPLFPGTDDFERAFEPLCG